MNKLMREEFEKWAREYCRDDNEPWLPLEMNKDGMCYDDNRTFSAWAAWKAAWDYPNKDREVTKEELSNLADNMPLTDYLKRTKTSE